MLTEQQFLAAVRDAVLRELDGLHPWSLSLRLDHQSERSAFVVARLGDGGAMIARVYGADLPSGFTPVFVSPDDAAVLVESFTRGREARLAL